MAPSIAPNRASNPAALTLDTLGISPLAGLCTHDEACRPGSSVDDTVALLKRYVYFTTQLNQVLAAHLPIRPNGK
jgi:hypothetical protein